MAAPSPKLFQPITLGSLQLNHRIVLAPLTRVRADSNHVPAPTIVRDYYAQRASTPGTLLITEGTFIAHKAAGYTNVPGIWSDAQIAAWKEARSCADPDTLASEDPSLPYVCISSPPSSKADKPTPRPLTVEELKEYAQLHATAASNAVFKAGFDGVEIHSANGYLLDQSLQDITNQRTDEYGGSVENRTRFVKEVVDAVVNAVGAERTAIRFSPWSQFNGMGMKDPVPTFSHITTHLASKYPSFAYLHVVEPRIIGNDDIDSAKIPGGASNDFIREIWKGEGRRYVSAGGYVRETGIQYAEEHDGHLIAYGRWFISNPDLPVRFMKNLKLTPYERPKFYLAGNTTSESYSDYPFADEA
ncbi:hypothetical protein ONZ45_g8225 [Pleurotus djamor]|nr:hypothetical protein ONZ45_g8225 [Pleurotus djamor]